MNRPMSSLTVAIFAFSSLIAASVLGCSNSSAGCTPTGALVPNPGPGPTIVIVVMDSVSGRLIADSATGRIAAVTYSDSLTHNASDPNSALESGVLGADTYAVAIVRPGYQQWLRSGIVVATSGACGAATPVQLTARLQPAP